MRTPLATVVRHAAETMADTAIRNRRAERHLEPGDRDAWEMVAIHDLLTAIDIASEREPLTPDGLRVVVEQAEQEWTDRYPVNEAAAS